MPLPVSVNVDTIAQLVMESGPTSTKALLDLARKIITEHGWSQKTSTYIMDFDLIEPHTEPTRLIEESSDDTEENSDNEVEYKEPKIHAGHRYEVSFSDKGVARVLSFMQNVKYDGPVSSVRLQMARKPRLRVRELVVPLHSVKFHEDKQEYEVHVRCAELFRKALMETQHIGFPKLEVPQQTYTLKFAAYYMNEEIGTAEVRFNPTNTLVSEDEIPDEYVMMLPVRPDHVRVLDVYLQYVSLYWLSELMNKLLDQRLGTI